MLMKVKKWKNIHSNIKRHQFKHILNQKKINSLI